MARTVLTAILLILMAWATPANAEWRIALVIGNSQSNQVA